MISKQGGLWRSLRYRPVLAGSIFVSSQLIGLACWFLVGHTYRAEATVLLDVEPSPVQVVSRDEKANAAAAKMALLTSRLLADRVVARLEMNKLPMLRESWEQMRGPGRPAFDDWLAAVAVGGLVPSGTPGSLMIKIGYASQSEQFAVVLANAFAEELVVLSDQLNKGFDRYADRAFDLAQKRTKDELTEAQAKLSASSKNELMAEGVFNPALRKFLSSSALTSRSVNAYLEGEATSQALGRMKDAGNLLDDKYLIEQQTKLGDLKSQRSQVATSMGEGHPVVKALDSNIRSVEAGIRMYEAKRRSSIAIGARSKGDTADQLESGLADMKADLLGRERAQRAYESDLQSVEQAGARYEDTLTQHEMMEINREVPRTDMRVVSKATLPDEYWFPRWYYYFPATFGLGALYALLGAYLMERRDRRVRSVSDVMQVVGVDLVDTM